MSDIEMGLVDAHLHLPETSDCEQVLAMASETGMNLFSVSTDEVDSIPSLRLKKERPEIVKFFAGVHPSKASRVPPVERLKGLVEEADGIGEVGLDPTYSGVEKGSVQMNTFTDQLSIAEATGKPVQIHSRKAERLCLDTLSSFRLKSVLLHWFEGEDLVTEACSKGYFVSFGPALLYSKRLRRIAQKYNQELILTESDSPVLYRPLGESVGGASMIASVVFALAELLRIDFESAELRISQNGKRFLSLLR